MEREIANGDVIRHDSLKEVDRNIRDMYNFLILLPNMTRNDND